jgi:uncharacterized protein (TIGR02145 family)
VFIAFLSQYSAQTIMNIYQNNGVVLQIPLNIIDSITYTSVNPGSLSILSTLQISNILETSAITGGNISSDGGSNITQRGIVWNLSPNPTTADNIVNSGTGIGVFNINLTGLAANTTYFLRAFAINSAGTAYGNELSFTTANFNGIVITNPGTGVTFNGYSYSSIVLGNGQEWMAENLRTTIYANGNAIPNITPPWTALTTGAWAHQSNDNQNEIPYGKLYNWYAVIDSRNVCPNGWHVPTNADWNDFINYLDPNSDGGLNAPGNTAGGKMKSIGTQYWLSPNQDATNESGFTGLPGGYFEGGNEGALGGWWSSSTDLLDVNSAWVRWLSYMDADAYAETTDFSQGFSIRCIKD